MQFAWVNSMILASNYPALSLRHNKNDSEMKRELEERNLHIMASINKVLKMW